MRPGLGSHPNRFFLAKAPAWRRGAAGAINRKDISMSALLSFLYGLIAYLVSVAALVYLIGFSGGGFVPKSVDLGGSAPTLEALCINVLLLSLFAVQHSVMARRSFKQWWTRLVPPAVERSTYVLAASIALALLFWQWRPVDTPVIWRVGNAVAEHALSVVFWFGWGLALASTFLINHFELFGLQHVFARLTRRETPSPQFKTPLLYRYVRHPLYLGILLGLWSVPVMTAGHLLFSLGSTAYIFVGVWFEERDLIVQFGERYRRYRGEVGMLLPRRSRL